MKYLLPFLFIALASNPSISQDKFEIKLNAPFLIHDSLLLSPPPAMAGFGEFHRFRLETSKEIRQTISVPYAAYYINIRNENSLHGTLEYAQPAILVYLDVNAGNQPLVSDVFFIEKGINTLSLPKISGKLEVNLDSPLNNEYKALKKQLAHLYGESDEYGVERLTNFEEENKILSGYIRKNPDSQVALWQIISEYDSYHSHPAYGANLALFSQEIKNSMLFKSFSEKLSKGK